MDKIMTALDELEQKLCADLAMTLDDLEVESIDAFGNEWTRGFAAGIRTALGHVRDAMGVE